VNFSTASPIIDEKQIHHAKIQIFGLLAFDEGFFRKVFYAGTGLLPFPRIIPDVFHNPLVFRIIADNTVVVIGLPIFPSCRISGNIDLFGCLHFEFPHDFRNQHFNRFNAAHVAA